MKVHPKADVQSVHIGENTVIWQFSVVLPGAVIGDHCNINAHCLIENKVVIGNNVTVKCGVYLWDGLEISDYVQIGPNVTFTNDLYPRAKQSFELLKTKIEKGASVGAGSTIIGGITIGEYALIGAGSLVTKDVLPHTLVYGSPAKFKAYVCDCGNKLNKDLHCDKCGKKFESENNIIKRLS